MKAINEIRIAGDDIIVHFASGKVQKTTIKDLDEKKFDKFKKQLKEEHAT